MVDDVGVGFVLFFENVLDYVGEFVGIFVEYVFGSVD